MAEGDVIAARAFLAGAGAFFIDGLLSVAELYPDFCTMIIHRTTDPEEQRS
jgi:hypothetical protein